MKDDFLIDSSRTTTANASGGWYPPQTKSYNFSYQDGQLVLLNEYNVAQYVWNCEGLLVLTGGAEGEECPHGIF
jgi:hypothetical protein